MPEKTYSFQVATNINQGMWKVADRTFHDRRLTISEQEQAWKGGNDLEILASALTFLKIEGQAITVEWLKDNLTSEPNPVLSDIESAFAYLRGGSLGIERALAAKQKDG